MQNPANTPIIIVFSLISFGIGFPYIIWLLTARKKEVCEEESIYPQVGPIDEPVMSGEFLDPLPVYEAPPDYRIAIDAQAYDPNSNTNNISLTTTNSYTNMNTTTTSAVIQ